MTQPESNWQHSHALETGDILVPSETGEEWKITTVETTGNIRVRRIDDGRRGPDDRDTWNEAVVRRSLANDELARKSDGKSHELATY